MKLKHYCAFFSLSEICSLADNASFCCLCRSPGGFKFNHQGHGPFVAYCPAGAVCHYHLCHHWTGVIHGEDAQDLLPCARGTDR